jgi:hypothetical protein
MSRKPPKRPLPSDMIQKGHWNGIKVSVVEDDRSPDEVQEARRAIWRKNRIWERPEGFSLVPKGRIISICFRRGEQLVDFAAEIAGNPAIDVVIFDDVPKTWIDVHTLECEPVSVADQTAIRNALIDWLTERGVRFSLGGVIITKREPR